MASFSFPSYCRRYCFYMCNIPPTQPSNCRRSAGYDVHVMGGNEICAHGHIHEFVSFYLRSPSKFAVTRLGNGSLIARIMLLPRRSAISPGADGFFVHFSLIQVIFKLESASDDPSPGVARQNSLPLAAPGAEMYSKGTGSPVRVSAQTTLNSPRAVDMQGVRVFTGQPSEINVFSRRICAK